MHLESLHLLSFKNYAEANVRFSPRINVLVGKNGSGKTNLVDAIYYLGLSKSAFSSTDLQCIRQGDNFFLLRGSFVMQEKTIEVSAMVQSGSKKIMREDGLDYQKISEHIGKYPMVLIAPDDVDLIREGSEYRRRFMDSVISQLDKSYLENLIQYNQALRLRNGLLKMYFERGLAIDWTAMESYDTILIKSGNLVFSRRKQFVEELRPLFNHYYQYLVQNSEHADLSYSSELTEVSFEEGLMKSRSKDAALQRTSFGIHRDDYDFRLGEELVRKFGSQGQQKSFVIALRLAQFSILERDKGFKPILLLDDIFDKLDDIRIGRLLELIKSAFGQLFITDARLERTRALLDQIHIPSTIFNIEQGTVSAYEQKER